MILRRNIEFHKTEIIELREFLRCLVISPEACGQAMLSQLRALVPIADILYSHRGAVPDDCESYSRARHLMPQLFPGDQTTTFGAPHLAGRSTDVSKWEYSENVGSMTTSTHVEYDARLWSTTYPPTMAFPHSAPYSATTAIPTWSSTAISPVTTTRFERVQGRTPSAPKDPGEQQCLQWGW